MAENVDDVAACLLATLGAMRPTRLQLLVYYAQAWHLAGHHEHLFDDPIEARPDGPVIRRLYDQTRGRDEVDAWPAGDPRRLGSRARGVIEWVLRSYGSFPDGELSRIARAEAPWRLARQGRLVRRSTKAVDPAVMATYYDRLRASPDTAVLVAVGSARLEGHEFGPREVDLLRAVAAGTRPADDIVAELTRRYRAS
ncbi:type II toxin-antitoxin system antitoxin SocA domain-containing protein [Pseudofrankia sp. DC12]|uniref:Panacea domain-containing protein n=1 Tax=Pseudofrankia sp. DC12 TaxID=683315 RepID=UPI0005F7A852|nr:type II toxin-antitoxin system antitoxin SocA domain-containing protein [Pseudofrankia sp. DC12]